jgi:REP element-mobilizing transposase RayT
MRMKRWLKGELRRLEHDLILLLKQRLWKERTLWSDGYFCGTIGNASQEAIGHSIAGHG